MDKLKTKLNIFNQNKNVLTQTEFKNSIILLLIFANKM